MHRSLSIATYKSCPLSDANINRCAVISPLGVAQACIDMALTASECAYEKHLRERNSDNIVGCFPTAHKIPSNADLRATEPQKFRFASSHGEVAGISMNVHS
jgi:hypothetical protein